MKNMPQNPIMQDLREWFDTYTHQFDSSDPVICRAMDLKREHTMRVCDIIVDIGKSLGLCPGDLHTAETAALLHDIGRFRQYYNYGTFSDSKSQNHADLGTAAIKKNNLLAAFDPEEAEIIIFAVKHHNRASLPGAGKPRHLFFLKMLRDADKLDIWRVVTDYYKATSGNRNPAIELELADLPRISDNICNSLLQRKPADMEDVKTLNDLKLLQMGWVYDLNFPRSFSLLSERGYLEMIRDAIYGESPRVEKIWTEIEKHLLQQKGFYESNHAPGHRPLNLEP
ncbi:MAG: HD domain-containing protein [Dissulfuribacterales bacterium]